MDIQQELTDEEREVIAERLLAEQRERFDGVRKAAYTAAGVNPATWARATSGARVRPDRLVLIVKSLWPDSHGDWSRVPQTRQAGAVIPEYHGPTWIADADDPWVSGQVAVKDYVDELMADADSRFIELEDRVRYLERRLAEALDPEDEEGKAGDQGDSGSSPATSEPGVGPGNNVTSLPQRTFDTPGSAVASGGGTREEAAEADRLAAIEKAKQQEAMDEMERKKRERGQGVD